MANTVTDQITAYGVAQVIVVLKPSAVAAPAARPSPAMAAAVPVATSRRAAGGAEPVVMDLAKHFRTSELSIDTALVETAAAAARPRRAAGVKWQKRAASPADPTPAVRYFPNLGLMLGTADRQGLGALKADHRVADVIAPPVLSLVRPVAAKPAKMKKTTTVQYTWGIRRLNAHKLHQRKITGKGIIVGHLDTGVDGRHSALKSAIAEFAEFDDLGFEVTPTPKPHDTDDHGTHTAGTIAGRTVNKRAIGVAPEAALASAIVIEGGNAIARVLAGMDWVIGKGARVLNMSLGFRGFTEDFLVITQILRDRGVLPVFAVGNEGPGTSRSPGNYAEALSVGAMDSPGAVADFSSSRRFDRQDDPLVPDLVAPGVAVVSAMPGGKLQEMDGSSMATPHIAGLAALLMSVKPDKTIVEIERAILGSCTPLPGQPRHRQNRGVPDAVAALKLL
jgi:subtilisin family serine protease